MLVLVVDAGNVGTGPITADGALDRVKLCLVSIEVVHELFAHSFAILRSKQGTKHENVIVAL